MLIHIFLLEQQLEESVDRNKTTAELSKRVLRISAKQPDEFRCWDHRMERS